MTKFITDSSCDLLEREDVLFESVSLTINTEERTYVDDETLDINEMLDDLRQYRGKSHTACPGVAQWMDAYERGNADRIYVVTMTSGLSGTYNSAVVAREQFLEEHKDVQIHIFDTLTTGPEMSIILDKIIEMDTAGMEFEEVCKKGAEYIKKTGLYFAFQSLHNFAQNGRVSKVVASAVGMMGISIIGKASADGKVEPITKSRSEKKTILKIIEEMENGGYQGGKIKIGHVRNEELALKFKQALLDRYPMAPTELYECRGICSYYGESGGILIGCENA
ncbi:MAG: DegV family protein [Lachnospiraceae bacterium]|nr:DegV family protein [Lachnospiraceae bacterium]